MKRLFKNTAALSTVLMFGLACNTNQVSAQSPGDLAKLLQKRAETRRLGGGATADTLVLPLSSRIVNYANSMMGKRVGRGECTDLVTAALKQAGAKPGDFSDPKNYIWGTLRLKRMGKSGTPGAGNAASPGDIIQFENCVFKKPDGSYTWHMPHHTAIVKTVNGSQVTLLHQNAPVGGPVREEALNLAWRTAGSVKVYTAVPK